MRIQNFATFYLISFFYLVGFGYGKVPSVRLCGNEKCTEIISMCKTTMNYNAGDKAMLSFRGNTPCRVMSKSVEKGFDLWEIEVQGRRGYAPKSMIMEQKIIIKAADLILIGEETKELAAEDISKDEVSFKNNTDSQFIIGSEINPSIDESDEKSNNVLPGESNNLSLTPVEEPLARKIDMYKTGTEKNEETENDVDVQLDDDGNPINIPNFMDVTNDIETSPKQDEKPSQKFITPPIESQKIEKSELPDVFDTVSNIDETIILKDMHSDSTSNLPAQNDIDVEKPNKIEITSNVPKLLKTAAANEVVPETNPNTFTNIINMDKVPNNEQQMSIATDFEKFTNNNNQSETSASTDDDERRNMLHSHGDEIEKIEESLVKASNHSAEQVGPTTDNRQINTHIHADSSEDMLKPIDKPPNRAEELITSFSNHHQKNMHISHEDVNEQSSEPLDKPSEQPYPEQQDGLTTNQQINSHVFHENVHLKPSDHSEEQIGLHTDNEQIFTPVSQEDVYNQNREPIYESSDNSQEQFVSITDNERIDTQSLQEDVTEENEKSLDKSQDHVENIFTDHSKEELPDIFHSHTDQGSEKNWYDVINSSLNEILLFAQSLYTSFFAEKNEISNEQCIAAGEQDENDFCFKNRVNGASAKPHDSNYVEFVHRLTSELIANENLKIVLLLEVAAIIVFIFGHYCLVNRRTENALISKLNATERRLFASEKECTIAKSEVIEKRKVLDGIADKSFGTDDMIKQLEGEKAELREQIYTLEKELETAAEAGLELNKMVAELLSSNQSGSDSIINSVEELQQQLNDQEATSVYINNLLAEKSRENSELRVQLSETNKKFGGKIDDLEQENKLLCEEREAIEIDLKNIIKSYKNDVEEKMEIISQLKVDYETLEEKYDDVLSKWQSSAAQAEAMEEALNQVKNASVDDIKSIQSIASANAKYLAAEKGNQFLKESLINETELRKKLQSQMTDLNSEITRLRSFANQNEKEKLEAQTRLEVLTTYFKEKETQLQSELDIKEALVMKQKGESTTTQLQDEIQGLRAQNEQLRAEIEAQSIAHKGQINTVEMRAHDSWLAAKQAERRLEEAKSESSVLRKKLTSLTQQFSSAAGNTISDGHTNDFNVPSPPSLNLPPPPLVPFLPPPPLPMNEIRPAPLGRLMSPPPDRFRYEELNDTETDFSPPRTPSQYRSKGSSSGSEWDRQTF